MSRNDTPSDATAAHITQSCRTPGIRMNVQRRNNRKRSVDGAVLAGDVYACQLCLYNSTDRSHMVRHIYAKHTHVNHKSQLSKYTCERCGKSFSTSSNAKRHERSCGTGQVPSRPAQTIKKLEQRIQLLEQQVTKLEKVVQSHAL